MFTKSYNVSKISKLDRGVASLDNTMKRNIGTAMIASRNSPRRYRGNSRGINETKKDIISMYFDKDGQ